MKEVLIESRPTLDRVAMLEDGKLVEIHYEDKERVQLVGSIFKGRIQNVLAGMQAAFVEIGQERNAYLSISDVNIPVQAEVREEPPAINRIFKKGQEVLVQVVKEPFGTKGARVSTQISLPGRYLVIGTGADYVGMSKKIYEPEERERLSEIMWRIKPAGMGLIARTVAVGVPEEALREDMENLLAQWQEIQRAAACTNPPALLHKEEGLIQRTIRDMAAESVDRILVENCPEVEDWVDEALISRIEYIDFDLFESRGIEPLVDKALQRRVWLPSGGNIYIDTTEALTVIDVNTGKYVGKADFAATVLKINLEAAEEIAYQLRLRDIGGIIVVDFIDMREEEDRQAVIDCMNAALQRDRTKSRIVGFTPLGLLELTRKKVRQHLSSALTEHCRLCDGTGYMLSAKALSWRAAQMLVRLLDTDAELLALECSPALAEHLLQLGILQKELAGIDRQVYLHPIPGTNWDEIRAVPVPAGAWDPDPSWCVIQ